MNIIPLGSPEDTKLVERSFRARIADVRLDLWRERRNPTDRELLDLACLYFQTEAGLDTRYDILTSGETVEFCNLMEALRHGKDVRTILEQMVTDTAREVIEKELMRPFTTDEVQA